MKLTLIALFVILQGCANIIRVDSSFVEGCVYGAYAVIYQVEKSPIAYKIDSTCMDIYLKRLEQVNPEYKLEISENNKI